MASFSARQEDHFQKKLSERAFCLDFIKLGTEILYLFLAEKWSFVVCFLLFVVCWLFVAILYPILAYFFLN